ncbi:hypothetical protein DB30_01748 [Enhygromyxa salina]|uniref:Uncharacterized protein n=1 Tax=Enhygromyxa salina TaxID=215803 RepID=A0A0C2CWP3_9BACT|nr:hypothetical protein [Enhygromyxa salina]KIG12272.1 hypothetical protein DB30_01748 [Enhygromyxa salina]
MRRLGLFLCVLPLACGARPDHQPEPPAKSAPTPASKPADVDDKAVNDEAADTSAPDCISASNLPPGSVPKSVAQWATLDLDLLAAALPVDPRDPGLAHTETSQWTRGQAGHPSPLVMRAIEPPGTDSRIVTITDLQDVCHCREGMGRRRHDAAIATGDTSETIDGHLVAVKTTEGVVDLRVWIADRCELLIRATTRGGADALLGATDMAALKSTCAARDAKGSG